MLQDTEFRRMFNCGTNVIGARKLFRLKPLVLHRRSLCAPPQRQADTTRHDGGGTTISVPLIDRNIIFCSSVVVSAGVWGDGGKLCHDE